MPKPSTMAIVRPKSISLLGIACHHHLRFLLKLSLLGSTTTSEKRLLWR
jgi:hypothetical protein